MCNSVEFVDFKEIRNSFAGVTLLFFLIFGFQISNINTRYIALLILLLLASFSKKNKFAIFKNKKIVVLLVLSVLYVILSIPLTIIHLQNDFSFYTDTVGVLLVEFSAVLFYSVFNMDRIRIMGRIIISFVIQSLVILLSFISPMVLEFIQTFQYDGAQEIAGKYLDANVIRGLALSGDLFFGLAASFGFVMLFSMYRYIKTRNSLYLLSFFLFIISSFFVGRTSLFGAALAILLFIISPFKKKSWTFIRFMMWMCFILGIIYAYLPSDLKGLLENAVFPFALELFYNLNSGDGFSTESTSDLLNMYQVPISFSTFLWGDGLFSDKLGGYYMNVDVGYMRQIYFAGIFYVLFSLIILFYMVFPFRVSKMKLYIVNLKNSKLDFFFSISIVFYFLVLHLKGLAIVHGKELMVLLTLYFCSLVVNNKRADENNNLFYPSVSC